MTATERELVAAVRAELAAIDPARSCDRMAELAGLGTAGDRDPTVSRLVVRLRRGARNDRSGAFDEPAWAEAPEHCRTAWLRGTFLANGSLSMANGRTHLEFVLEPTAAKTLASRLAGMGLPASLRLRRGRGVVTWKSAETVGRFLRLAGASAALLELEARAVSRALRGELNRIVNAEEANLSRSVAAAGRQIAAIEAMEAAGLLAEQPVAVRRVAQARRDAPEASLADLAARTDLNRSAVQRALERIARQAAGPGLRPATGRTPDGLATR